MGAGIEATVERGDFLLKVVGDHHDKHGTEEQELRESELVEVGVVVRLIEARAEMWKRLEDDAEQREDFHMSGYYAHKVAAAEQIARAFTRL